MVSRKTKTVLLCVLAVTLLNGCQVNQRKAVPFESSIRSFPKIMEGIWEAKTESGERWIIKFEKDGVINKIEHFVAGPIIISEGGVSGQGSDAGTQFVFVLGVCDKSYDSKTQKLYLEINIDYYEMVLPQGKLSGRIKDTFTGKISADGKTWETDWRNYGWLDEAQDPNIKEIEENPVKLVFKKIDISTISNETGTNS
jgi:hypothetical protein